jgi:hypothetical protein
MPKDRKAKDICDSCCPKIAKDWLIRNGGSDSINPYILTKMQSILKEKISLDTAKAIWRIIIGTSRSRNSTKKYLAKQLIGGVSKHYCICRVCYNIESPEPNFTPGRRDYYAGKCCEYEYCTSHLQMFKDNKLCINCAERYKVSDFDKCEKCIRYCKVVICKNIIEKTVISNAARIA